MKNVIFRVDGGREIGLGHIMRCISLAKEFKKRGCNVVFVSRLEVGIEIIRENGFKCHKIGSGDKEYFHKSEHEFSNEISKLTSIITEIRPDVIIIDTYNVNEKYFPELRESIGNEHVKLCYIDDWNKFKYHVDIIINGNITGALYPYQKIYTDSELLLTGAEYCILRDEFLNIPKKKINKTVKQIMITSGGADINNMCYKIAKNLLSNYNRIVINIVLGIAFEDKSNLYELAKVHENIVLHENVKKMSQIMFESDIAVSSGGSTLYELCRCGTPTLTYITADNQEALVEAMDKSGYIVNMGWINNFSQKSFEEKIGYVLDSYDYRVCISEKMQTFIDGKGKERIVTGVLNILDK